MTKSRYDGDDYHFDCDGRYHIGPREVYQPTSAWEAKKNAEMAKRPVQARTWITTTNGFSFDFNNKMCTIEEQSAHHKALLKEFPEEVWLEEYI